MQTGSPIQWEDSDELYEWWVIKVNIVLVNPCGIKMLWNDLEFHENIKDLNENDFDPTGWLNLV